MATSKLYERYRVNCSHCKATIRVGEKHLGQRAKCPRCKEAIDIPLPRPVPAKPLTAKAVVHEGPRCATRGTGRCGIVLDRGNQGCLSQQAGIQRRRDRSTLLVVVKLAFLFGRYDVPEPQVQAEQPVRAEIRHSKYIQERVAARSLRYTSKYATTNQVLPLPMLYSRRMIFPLAKPLGPNLSMVLLSCGLSHSAKNLPLTPTLVSLYYAT